MRHASLRFVLVAFTALAAAPVVAQEAPPVADPAPRMQDILPGPPVSAPTVAPPPLIVVGEGAETAAPTIEPIPRVWSPSPRDVQGRTAYGLYLTGRSALARGQAEQGARPPIDPAPPARQIPALRFTHEDERQAWRLSGERRPQSSPGCV